MPVGFFIPVRLAWVYCTTGWAVVAGLLLTLQWLHMSVNDRPAVMADAWLTEMWQPCRELTRPQRARQNAEAAGLHAVTGTIVEAEK